MRKAMSSCLRRLLLRKVHNSTRNLSVARRYRHSSARGRKVPIETFGVALSVSMLLVATIVISTTSLDGIGADDERNGTGTIADNTLTRNESLLALAQWLRQNGIPISHSCENDNDSELVIFNTEKEGVSIKRRQKNDASSNKKTIATIPSNIIIDSHTLQDINGPVPVFFRDWLSETLADETQCRLLTERRILILYIMLQQQQSLSQRSKSPHLQTFPTLNNSNGSPLPLLFWPKSEQQRLLHDTELMRPLLAKERALRQEWNDIMRHWWQELKHRHSDGNGDINENADFGNFCWSDSLFWTRVLEYETEASSATKHFVPLVDLCNHSYKPTCQWTVDNDGNVSLLVLPPSSLVEGKRGDNDENDDYMEHCYITYGHKSNAELLFSHGFCVDDNPYDSITWSILDDYDGDSLRLNDGKKKVLEILSLPPRISLHRQRQELDFNEEVLGFLDLDSIYILFLLVLEDSELVPCENRSDCFECQLKNDPDGNMTIECYDDFEELCDKHCDILIPRAKKLLQRLIQERRRVILFDSCFHSLVETMNDAASTLSNPRERFVYQFLSGQLSLFSDVTKYF